MEDHSFVVEDVLPISNMKKVSRPPVGRHCPIVDEWHPSCKSTTSSWPTTQFGMSVGSGAQEFDGAVLSGLQEAASISRTGRPSPQAPPIRPSWRRSRSMASSAAFAVGLFDALSVSAARRLAGPVSKLAGGGVKGGAAGGAAELGMQAGAGGAGEKSAQVLTGENDPNAVAMEMAAELPGTVVEPSHQPQESLSCDRQTRWIWPWAVVGDAGKCVHVLRPFRSYPSPGNRPSGPSVRQRSHESAASVRVIVGVSTAMYQKGLTFQ